MAGRRSGFGSESYRNVDGPDREGPGASHLMKGRPEARRGRDLRGVVAATSLDEETLEAIERQIECRRESAVRFPEL